VPELPELEVARERLEEASRGRRILRADVVDPFVLRTVEPPLAAAAGRRIEAVQRRGKVLRVLLEGSIALDVHLMRAGRLRLRPAAGHRPHRRRTLLVVELEGDRVVELTEAGTERRASLRVIDVSAPAEEAPPGLEPLASTFTPARLAEALRRENRRLKGALRSPDVVAGIGNAYSDEILHAARLSPLRLTGRLEDEEIVRLHVAIVGTLRTWIERVRAACPPGTLPEKQDPWRRGFAVHARAGQACPACGDRIERISYRDSETDYCPTCQNEGRVLADRRLSRLGIRGARRPPPPSA
jgi:formamidopyrimidine-DNA glycosylase